GKNAEDDVADPVDANAAAERHAGREQLGGDVEAEHRDAVASGHVGVGEEGAELGACVAHRGVIGPGTGHRGVDVGAARFELDVGLHGGGDPLNARVVEVTDGLGVGEGDGLAAAAAHQREAAAPAAGGGYRQQVAPEARQLG